MFINKFKTFLFLTILSLLLLAFGGLLGGANGIKIALIISLVINFVTYFFSDKIVLGLYGAQKLDQESYGWIYSIVTELSASMNIPEPKLWIIDTNMANAFATGRNPKHGSVALTTGIINILDKNELRGVIAHELSHIKNRDILISTVAATVATAISYLASFVRHMAIWGSFGASSNKRNGNPIVLIIVSILMPIAAIIMQLAISRSREYLADETGAKHSHDPLALASALEKLHNRAHYTQGEVSGAKESTASLFIVSPFSGKSLITLFSTHPAVDDRINRLRKIYEQMHNI